jgi:hypothetical protein
MRFSNRLRGLGFSEDPSEGAPICRWLIDQMKLDVMPTDESVFGFSNRWYTPAVETAALVELEGYQLRVVTTPYFIGTKLEAFRGRGRGDFYASSDLEDIITVLDGRPTILEEVADSPSELHRYIGREIGKLLDDPEFVNALPGHLAGDELSQARVPMILKNPEFIERPRAQTLGTATDKKSEKGKSKNVHSQLSEYTTGLVPSFSALL